MSSNKAMEKIHTWTALNRSSVSDPSVGLSVAAREGDKLELLAAIPLGLQVGDLFGTLVGLHVGQAVGLEVGLDVGVQVGLEEGHSTEGALVSPSSEGRKDGVAVGD